MLTRNRCDETAKTRAVGRSRLMAVVVLAVMLGVALLRYGTALNNGWCCDDPQILLHALRYTPIEYFFEPAAWQALIPYSLTPWLSLAYDLDHGLFGFQANYYYLHNLLVIGLCGGLLYLLARPWLGDLYAAAAGGLFLVGAPTALASQQLMVRHYSEGMLFFLLAMLLSRRAVVQQRGAPALAAGLAFAIAASAKEIWLPLGVLAFLMPVGRWRERLRRNWPILAVMLLYVPWRFYMLGELIGGYTPATALQAQGRLWPFIDALLHAPAHFWLHPRIAVGGLFLIALGAVLRDPRASLRAVPWLLALVVCLLGPLYPLMPTPGLGAGSERYFIASWAALALITGLLGFQAAKGRGAPVRIAVLLVFLALGFDVWQRATPMLEQQQEQQARYRAVGDALATLDAETVILGDLGLPTWFNQGIIDLRPAMGNSAAPPRLISDLVWLEDQLTPPRRYLAYQAGQPALVDISGQIEARRKEWRTGLRRIPMSIRFEHDRQAGVLSWQLAAGGAPGTYALLNRQGAMVVPEQGQIRMLSPERSCFRIRFQANEGWYAYGPPMALPVDGQRVIDWRGDTELFQAGSTRHCPQGAS